MKTKTLAILATVIATSPIFAGEKAADTSKVVIPEPRQQDIWVHPVTGTYFHEDSFITTDLRPVFAYHAFPGQILGGGRALVAAAQLRVKLTDSLQLVAYKDGWMEVETAGLNNGGWNDIAAGIKWAFLQDNANQLHAALGVGYEFASGDRRVLQDDDELRFWASINKGYGRLHFGATVNYLLSTRNGSSLLGDSDQFTWHLHADYQVNDWFSPFLEMNGYLVTNNGSPVTPFSGVDVLNLGGNSSEPVVTGAAGIEVRPLKPLALRAAWEMPFSKNLDVYGHRWTFSAVIKF